MHNARSPLRFGLIGCGFKSGLYHHIFTGFRCTIAACCDPTPSRLERFAKEQNIAGTYTGYRDLIGSPHPDGIINAAPDYLHIPVASAAATAERPASSGSSALMVINFSRRNAPVGVTGDLGRHLFDLVELLSGGVSLLAAAQQRALKDRSSTDAFHARVRLESGAEGIVQSSRIASGEDDRLCLETYGSRGSCRMDLEKDRKGVWFYDNPTGRREYLEGKKGTGTMVRGDLDALSFVSSIDIEGHHDPYFRRGLELTGQVRALEYLCRCRGGSWIPKPTGGT
jgi:predicted dehydrogenase